MSLGAHAKSVSVLRAAERIGSSTASYPTIEAPDNALGQTVLAGVGTWTVPSHRAVGRPSLPLGDLSLLTRVR